MVTPSIAALIFSLKVLDISNIFSGNIIFDIAPQIKSKGVGLDECGGQAFHPPRPIQLWRNLSSKKARTNSACCGGIPSSCKMEISSSIRGTLYSSTMSRQVNLLTGFPEKHGPITRSLNRAHQTFIFEELGSLQLIVSRG